MFQFLWRDLSSEFDVIGSYFKSETGMKHQFVMMYILNTTHAFNLYSFEVMAIVLDGASTNLAAMKYFTMGRAQVLMELMITLQLMNHTTSNHGSQIHSQQLNCFSSLVHLMSLRVSLLH